MPEDKNSALAKGRQPEDEPQRGASKESVSTDTKQKARGSDDGDNTRFTDWASI